VASESRAIGAPETANGIDGALANAKFEAGVEDRTILAGQMDLATNI
jgi:hypothetical protein